MRLLLTFILLCATTLAAPLVEVDSRLNNAGDEVPFGKPVELVLEVRYPSGEFTPPKADSLTLDEATIIDRFKVEHRGDGMFERVDYHLVFTRLRPGEYTVGPISLGSGIQSDPLSVTFIGATPKEDDKPGEIRTTKPFEAPSTADFWKSFAQWLGAGFLIVLGLLALLSRRGLLDRIISPRSRALRRLKRIPKREKTGDGIALGAVEVVRYYLAQAYGLRTREATTQEIIGQMKEDAACQTFHPVAKKILSQGDKIKFAGSNLTHQQAMDLYHDLHRGLLAEERIKK